MTKGCVSSLLAVGLLSYVFGTSLAFAERPLPALVIFGDSLSDPGNLFALQKTNNVPPSYDVDQFLVPNSPYATGGHHLSNGPTWAEDLAKLLGLAANAEPAWRKGQSPAANYAVAGARGYDAGQPFDFPDQVARFVNDLGGLGAPSEALYVIEFGGNDIRDALRSGNLAVLVESLNSISAGVSALYQAGARKFLVVNVASIGLLPSVRALESAFPGISGLGGLADQLTQQFNVNLTGAVTILQQSLPGIQIVQFNLYALINGVYTQPLNFGLTEVNVPCITPDVPPYKCTNPDEFAFWDGIHPTKALHAIIAQQGAQVLAQ